MVICMFYYTKPAQSIADTGTNGAGAQTGVTARDAESTPNALVIRITSKPVRLTVGLAGCCPGDSAGIQLFSALVPSPAASLGTCRNPSSQAPPGSS